jgi:hypothetical protein
MPSRQDAVSERPAATGVPGARPSSVAAAAVSLPATEWDSTTGASSAGSIDTASRKLVAQRSTPTS